VPRRQQRRPTFQSKKTNRSMRGEDTGALDAGARRVLFAQGSDPQRLAALIVDLRQLRDEADRVAYGEPSPDALRAYRRAARELAEAERALVLAGGA
jgi:hypothetical protein